jgi:integrase
MAYYRKNRVIADAEYDDGNGISRRLHRGFDLTKDEVKKIEAYFRATGEILPEYAVSKGPVNSFEAVARKCAAQKPEWQDKTRSAILEFAIRHLGNLDIKVIRTSQLEKFADKVRQAAGKPGQPPAPATVNNYLNVVAVVLKYAHERDMIEGMPHVPRVSPKGKTRHAVSLAMENAICRKLDDITAFLVRILASTGMRRGELCSLRPEQIILERDENSGWLLTKEQTKTGTERWVPMSLEPARKLKAIIASGKVPVAWKLSTQFQSAAISCGDGLGLSLHCLRHTFATRLSKVEANPLLVAVLIGHSTGVMTSRYLKPTHEELYEIAKKVHTVCGEIVKTGELVPLNPKANQAVA